MQPILNSFLKPFFGFCSFIARVLLMFLLIQLLTLQGVSVLHTYSMFYKGITYSKYPNAIMIVSVMLAVVCIFRNQCFGFFFCSF
jgi:hypothetical protein